MGEFDADEFSMAEGASDASGMQRLPDFKSMLEAALRGDVVSLNLFCVTSGEQGHRLPVANSMRQPGRRLIVSHGAPAGLQVRAGGRLAPGCGEPGSLFTGLRASKGGAIASLWP